MDFTTSELTLISVALHALAFDREKLAKSAKEPRHEVVRAQATQQARVARNLALNIDAEIIRART